MPEILTPNIPEEETRLAKGTDAGGARDAVAAAMAAAAAAVIAEAFSVFKEPNDVGAIDADETGSGSSREGLTEGRLAKNGLGIVFLFGLSITGAGSNFKCGLAALYF